MFYNEAKEMIRAILSDEHQTTDSFEPYFPYNEKAIAQTIHEIRDEDGEI